MDDNTNRDFLGKGIAFPFNMDSNGNISMSSLEKSIEESIFIILNTKMEERILNSDFGSKLNNLMFAKNSTETHNLASHYIYEAILNWENRIIITDVQVSKANLNKINIEISYIVRTTNVSNNLVYPCYLESENEDFDI